MLFECFQEASETGDLLFLHLIHPHEQPTFTCFWCIRAIENGGQFFPKRVSSMKFWRVFEQASQAFSFFLVEVDVVLAEQPQGSFAVLVIGLFRQFLFQPLHFLFAQIIEIISIVLGDMETIYNQLRRHVLVSSNVLGNRMEIDLPTCLS